MRERDIYALEFDKVLHLLAGCTLSSAGHEACLALTPHTARAVVEADSEQTWQFFRLLEKHLSIPLRQFPDIRSSLAWAAQIGAALEGEKLLNILEVMTLSRTLAAFFRRQAGDYDQLRDLPETLLA